MAFNGSGTFLRLYSWAQDKLNGLKITASRMDNEFNGMADGLSNCLTLDGQSLPKDDIPWNSKRLTNLGDMAAATDGVNRQSGDARWAFRSSGQSPITAGANNAYTLTTGLTLASLTDGQEFAFRVNVSSTATDPTLNIDGIGAKAIRGPGNAGLPAGALVADGAYRVVYVAASNNFRMTTGAIPGTIPGSITITGTFTGEQIVSHGGLRSDAGICYLSADLSRYIQWNGANYFLGGRNGAIVTASDGATFTTSMTFASTVFVGAISGNISLSGAQFNITNTGSNGYGYLSLLTAGDCNNNFLGRIYRSNNTTDYFMVLVSDYNGTPDTEFKIRQDGSVYGDGAYTVGADYAEWFEWFDGNPDHEDRVGIAVELHEGKIVPAFGVAASVIGVVSARPSVVGDDDLDQWKRKYLIDDFGREIKEDADRAYWIDETEGAEPQPQCEWVDRPRIEIPAYAEIYQEKRRILNPAFNPDLVYVSRRDRPEWCCVGLTGKLRMRKGQLANPRWNKLRDISDAVEEWLVR